MVKLSLAQRLRLSHTKLCGTAATRSKFSHRLAATVEAYFAARQLLMKTQIAATLLGLMCVGCVTEPASYTGYLSHSDRKWQSPACRDARQRATSYEVEEKERLKSSVMIGFLSPSSALATVNVTNQQNVHRKRFNRDLHLACSSTALPDDLKNIPELQPPPLLDTTRGS